MSNYLTVKTLLPFENAIHKVAASLMEEGFGIVSEIDLKKVFNEKIDADFRNYKIFGACNPDFTYRAILLEDRIGTLLPCNIIVQEQKDGVVEVSALDPLQAMCGIDNIKLKVLAFEVGEKLKKVLNNI